MITKRPYSTADGKRFQTIERAIRHALKMRSSSLPEYIFKNGAVTYILYPDGSAGYPTESDLIFDPPA